MSQESIKAEVYVGIDIHRDKHWAAVIPRHQMEDGSWQKAKTLGVRNTRPDLEGLVSAIKEHTSKQLWEDPSQVAIAVDHTGGHYAAPLVHHLTGQGYRVWFLQAKALKQVKNGVFGTEDKSDVLDAREMAFYLYAKHTLNRDMRVTLISPSLASHSSILGALVREHQAITRLHTKATNRLRHLLASTFPEGEAKAFNALADLARFCPTPQDILDFGDEVGAHLRRASLDKLKALARETVGIQANGFGETIKSLAWHRYSLGEQIAKLEPRIQELVQSHPYSPIMRSFPFLGDIGIASLIATIGDISRFSTKKQFRKHLGVYVVTAQSGRRSGQRVMGREGSKDARRVLFQAIFTSISPHSQETPYRTYYQKLRKAGKKGKPAIVAVMGKYAEHLYHCLSSGEFYKNQGTVGTRPEATPLAAHSAPEGEGEEQ